MQLQHKEEEAKNLQNSEQKLLTNLSHSHSPLQIEVSISIFTYFKIIQCKITTLTINNSFYF